MATVERSLQRIFYEAAAKKGPHRAVRFRATAESARIGVVTNRSDELGQRAAAPIGAVRCCRHCRARGCLQTAPEPYEHAIAGLGLAAGGIRRHRCRARQPLTAATGMSEDPGNHLAGSQDLPLTFMKQRPSQCLQTGERVAATEYRNAIGRVMSWRLFGRN